MEMTSQEKAFLRSAIANGGIYTTPIRSTYDPAYNAIKQISIEQPWGHKTNKPINGVIGKLVDKRPMIPNMPQRISQKPSKVTIACATGIFLFILCII